MKAIRLYAAGDLRVEDIPAPAAPGAGEVLVAVTAAGICGSDLHNYRSGAWISRSPSVAGHEFAGVVTALGPGVDAVAIGDTVVADLRVSCGVCPACRGGRPNVCEKLGFVGEVIDGGFAEAVRLPAALLVKAPARVDRRALAMAEPLAVALHALKRLGALEGSPVLIAGCGPIGGLAALLLTVRHNGPVLVTDRNADRAGRVAEVTGASVVDLTTAAVAAALADKTPLLAALDATGNVGVIGSLADLIAPGGRLALVGIGHGSLAIDPTRLVEREIAVLGCHAFGDELAEAVALTAELEAQLLALIDEVIDLDGVPAAYDRLLAGRSTGLKTIIAIGHRAGERMIDLGDGASPLYEKVKVYVLDNIASGAWPRQQRLPSENELVSDLRVSRMTVHRALRELTGAGHLVRIQGVGTFVAPVKAQSTLIEVANIASEIRARGHRHRSEMVLMETVPACGELMAAFEFSRRTKVYHSQVVHFEDDVPVQLEDRHVNPALVPDYIHQDFSQIATYDYLLAATPLTEVEHVISALPASADTAARLAIAPGQPCLVLNRRTWSSARVATVNTLTYVGSRYSLGSRYVPKTVG